MADIQVQINIPIKLSIQIAFYDWLNVIFSSTH